jgi:hypothetical protein
MTLVESLEVTEGVRQIEIFKCETASDERSESRPFQTLRETTMRSVHEQGEIENLLFTRLSAKGATATARRFHIRVVELESGAFQTLHIIDFGAV